MAGKILGTSKLSGKFQVTIPKDAREMSHLEAGDRVAFYDENGELVLRKG